MGLSLLGMSLGGWGQAVAGLAVVAVVLWVTQKWLAFAHGCRQMAAVGPRVVLATQLFAYFCLPALLLPRHWALARWLFPFAAADYHVPLNALFRRTGAPAVGHVSLGHVELFLKYGQFSFSPTISLLDKGIKGINII